MQNTNDGKVVINIDSNAAKAAKEFERLDTQTQKYNDTLKDLKATGFSETKKTINLLKKEMNDMALAGLKDTKVFKDFASEVRLAQSNLNNAKNTVNQAIKGNNNFAKSVKDAKNNSVQLSDSLGLVNRFAAPLSGVFGAIKLKDLAVDAIKTAGAFEQLGTSFSVMTGSQQIGEQLTNELIKLANVTPMTTKGLAQNAQMLLSFGESVDNIIPDLKLLGNVSGGNAQRMQSLTLAFSQAGSMGKLMGQDLLQMVNAGFNPLEAISKRTGKSVGQLRAEMEEGKITFNMVRQAMKDATSEGGRFFGLMEKQAETLDGKLSTLADTWEQVSNNIGKLFIPAAKDATDWSIKLGNAIQTLTGTMLENQRLADLLKTEVTKMSSLADATDRAIEARAELYRLESKYKKGGTTTDYYKQKKGELEQEIRFSEDWAKVLAKNSGLTKVGVFNTDKQGLGSSIYNKQKDKKEKRQLTASEQLQKDYNDGVRYLQDLAAQGIKSGEIWDKQVSNVKGLSEAIKSMKNATDESLLEPLQLLNKHIQDAQDRVNNLAASKIVNLAELRSAKVELTDLKNKMQEMQIAAETSPFRAMQARKSHLEAQYLDMSILGQANTPQAIALKNAIKQYENDIKRAQNSLSSYMGVSWENISSSISTNLSQAITTPLQEGENALERFGNVALNTFQMIAQSYISSFINAKMMGVQQNGGLFQELFGNKGGNVTGGAAQITELKKEIDKLAGSIAPVGASIAQIGGTQTAAITAFKASSSAITSSVATYKAAAVAAQQLASSITQAAIAQAAFSAAKAPIAGAALAPIAAMATGASIGAANMLASAGMLASRITAFKDGGVVDRATYFPMKGNRMGLMGEAGSEAIMPLRRTSDGRLGVEASNVSQPNIHIYNQSGSQIETVQRPDGDYEIFIRKVNSALNNERTNAGFTRAMQRNSSKGIQAC